MSTAANVVLPKEKKVRVKKADVQAPAPVAEKVASPKPATPKPATPKPTTPKPAVESEAEEKPVKEVKPRKPTLSAKYTKFVVFGYSMVNALVAAGIIPEDQLDSAYAQIKLMESVEDQTAFYSNFLENLSASGKAMKKFVNDKKKPPKEPKVRKPRAKKADSDAEPKAPKEKKPRAKKEAKAESESESEPKKEKKPRAKKSVTVESDANVDLISNLVNAAQADPIPAPVDAPAEAPTKAKKEPKPKAVKEPKAKAKKEAPAPVVEPTPALEAEDDDDDEVIQTRETVIDGETFLVDQEGNLYDPETHEFVRKL
jgi:antigen KI-67